MDDKKHGFPEPENPETLPEQETIQFNAEEISRLSERTEENPEMPEPAFEAPEEPAFSEEPELTRIFEEPEEEPEEPASAEEPELPPELSQELFEEPESPEEPAWQAPADPLENAQSLPDLFPDMEEPAEEPPVPEKPAYAGPPTRVPRTPEKKKSTGRKVALLFRSIFKWLLAIALALAILGAGLIGYLTVAENHPA